MASRYRCVSHRLQAVNISVQWSCIWRQPWSWVGLTGLLRASAQESLQYLIAFSSWPPLLLIHFRLNPHLYGLKISLYRDPVLNWHDVFLSTYIVFVCKTIYILCFSQKCSNLWQNAGAAVYFHITFILFFIKPLCGCFKMMLVSFAHRLFPRI